MNPYKRVKNKNSAAEWHAIVVLAKERREASVTLGGQKKKKENLQEGNHQQPPNDKREKVDTVGVQQGGKCQIGKKGERRKRDWLW